MVNNPNGHDQVPRAWWREHAAAETVDRRHAAGQKRAPGGYQDALNQWVATIHRGGCAPVRSEHSVIAGGELTSLSSGGRAPGSFRVPTRGPADRIIRPPRCGAPPLPHAGAASF